MKRTLPYFMTIVPAVIVLAGQFFGVFPKAVEEIDKWYILSTAVVCCVGLVNLTAVHTRNIRRRAKDWELSLLLLVITYAYTLLGVFTNATAPLYSWIFNATTVPIGATFYSLLAFYIVSAAYRAFRARTRDAAILLIAGVLVLLGNAPIGEAIYPGFGVASKWIMDIGTAAGMRAVILGATIGAFITAIRVIFGIDRPYAGAAE